MFKKLRNKFLLINVLLTSLVLLGTFTALFSIVYWNTRHDAEQRLSALPSCSEQNDITAIPAAGSVVRYITDIIINGEHLGSSTFFKISVTADGEISKSNPNYWMMEDAYKQAAYTAWEQQSIYRVIALGGTKWQANIVASSKVANEYDIFFLDVTSSQKLLTNLLYIFLGIAPLTLFAVFLISRKTANKAVHPISEAWDKQRQFVTDASHELKTPLAIINANTDALLLDVEADLESRKKWIGNIKDETSRMSELVNELLYLAKVEGNSNHEVHSEFDFGQCLSDICIVTEAMIYEKNITLDCDIEENIILFSSEPKVKKLLSILIDNAIKYTNEGGRICIQLKRRKSNAEMVIENSGAGISAETLPHVFDRFYRADKARENEDGSYGLGLAIAKSISEQLGGKLSASSIPNEKTTFTFHIKAHQ